MFMTVFLAVSLITISRCFFIVNNFFKIFLKSFLIYFKQRRRRDLNPRAAINDLHPFQGCPFGQLGYFSELVISIISFPLEKDKIHIVNLIKAKK